MNGHSNPRLVQTAAHAAVLIHATQKRRYLADAYIVHPARVAHATMLAGLPDEAVAAAWLHDIIEDSPKGATELKRFDSGVQFLVATLSRSSHQNPGAYYVALRAVPIAATIKLFDRADNFRDLAKAYALTLGREHEAVRSWATSYMIKTDEYFDRFDTSALPSSRADLAEARALLVEALRRY